MKMRILAIALTLAMVFGMMPTVAFAEDTEPQLQTIYDSAIHINPLYADVIEASDVEVYFHENAVYDSGAEAIADEEKVYHTDISEVIPDFRAALEQRSDVFKFSAMIPMADFDVDGYLVGVFNKLFDGAVTHTGGPTQGDYIKWHYQSSRIGAARSWYPGDTEYMVDFTITMMYHTDAAQEAAVTARVDSLLAELNPTGTDYQKIKTVYDWMCSNIVYDYDNLADYTYYLKYSAYAALINGTSVCQGYANLLYRLALEMGIDCRVITGYSLNSDGDPEAHAWNIVKLGDSYYNLDATWDAPYAEHGWEYNYFLKSQDGFENHTRNADYTTSAFNAAYPMSGEDFDPSQDVVEDEEIIASGTCLDNLTWKIAADGTMTISGVGDMYFPDNPYTSELEPGEAPWADYANYVTNIVIEEGVTNIYFGAFRNFSSLESISIPDTVTQIWDEAFMNCYWLQEIDIPDSVSRINSYAFAGCGSLTSVVIPEGVTVIDYGCFSECYWLSDVSLPSSLERISDYAFFACALRDCVIPNSVTYIGEYAFYGCSYLNCSIPDSVTEVGNSAFGGTGLTNVVIPNGVTKLDAAFKGCTELKSVTIPESVTSIGAEAFWDCSSLTSITIPSGVVQIGDGAFNGCTSLMEINIPDGVTAIGYEAFRDCENLKEIALPESITSIGSYAFYECASLEKVNIPSGIAVLEQCVFARCYNLKEITIPYGVTTIGASAFECTMIEEIIIPDTVTSIEWQAFSGCQKLKSIDIPSGVTQLGGTFRGCSSLTSIELPDTLTYIGDYTFAYCDSLTSIVIPKSVTYISDSAFRSYSISDEDDGCKSLESITVSDGNANYTSIDGVLFDKDVTRLIAYPHSKPEGEYVVPESVESYNERVFMWCNTLTSITLPAEILSIEPWMFAYCDSLENVIIPDSVVLIDNFAFMWCRNLKTIELPDGLEWIGGSAFSCCTALENVEIPDGVYMIDGSAFSGCTNLTDISLPDGLQIIGNLAFSGCKALRNIIIPENVTTIGYHAFEDCENLKTVTFKGDAPYNESDAFYRVDATAYYPQGNETWTADVMQGYGGTINWVSYNADEHEHNYESVVTVPTCEKGGYTTYTCACGDTYVADEVPALDHDMGDWVVTDATCTADGSKTRTCRREGCDHTETEVIAATGHNHVPTVTAPTCTEKGYTTYTCACGDSYTADETAALGHDHAYSLTAAPTERASGQLTGICARCADEIGITLPKLNKDDYDYAVLTEPTEEAEGLARYIWKDTAYGVYSFDVTLNKLGSVILGDVNGDGSIGISDLMRLANHFAKGVEIDEACADVNGDGKVTIADLMRLANFFAGKAQLG